VSAELAETVAAEVVEPMNREDAEKLDGRIRRMAKESKRHLDTLATLVDQAKAGRIHEALEYPSWTAYLADALSELCSGHGIESRRELVAYLYDATCSRDGMSCSSTLPRRRPKWCAAIMAVNVTLNAGHGETLAVSAVGGPV
jgi:hypothetical protein